MESKLGMKEKRRVDDCYYQTVNDGEDQGQKNGKGGKFFNEREDSR